MKEYFLNFMICICAAGILLSLISLVFALIDWNELDFLERACTCAYEQHRFGCVDCEQTRRMIME